MVFERNTRNSKLLTNLTKNFCLLKAFVHVSTAFNNLSRERIEEEIYPGDIDPITLVNFINNVDEELIESITKQYSIIINYR